MFIITFPGVHCTHIFFHSSVSASNLATFFLESRHSLNLLSKSQISLARGTKLSLLNPVPFHPLDLSKILW
ncbi:TPA: hypothetical protein DEG21_05200 [Patescibacteria group bacterium]|nr:hypothetical protein [Candidatus Gracilibacteria bacterium]HBY75226.1 hypothetical protein [Candidatus Gracilibacteria bacterium]